MRPDYVGCIPYFPAFTTFAITLGYETVNGDLRFLGGPAWLTEGRNAAVGLLGRVDGAMPLLWHTSLAVSLRGAVIPDFRGDSFQIGAFSLGLRFR